MHIKDGTTNVEGSKAYPMHMPLAWHTVRRTAKKEFTNLTCIDYDYALKRLSIKINFFYIIDSMVSIKVFCGGKSYLLRGEALDEGLPDHINFGEYIFHKDRIYLGVVRASGPENIIFTYIDYPTEEHHAALQQLQAELERREKQ